MKKRAMIIAAAGALAWAGLGWAAGDCDCHRAGAPLEWRASWYAGASASQSTFGDWSVVRNLDDGSYDGHAEDNRSTGYRAFAGLDFLGYLGLEAGYGDFGRASFSAQSDGTGFFWDAGPVRDEIELQGMDLSLLARVPLPGDVALAGQLGALRWHSETLASGSPQGFGPSGYTDKENGTDLLYGARAEYAGLPSVRLTLAYVRSHFDVPSREDASLEAWTLSAAYRF